MHKRKQRRVYVDAYRRVVQFYSGVNSAVFVWTTSRSRKVGGCWYSVAIGADGDLPPNYWGWANSKEEDQISDLRLWLRYLHKS